LTSRNSGIAALRADGEDAAADAKLLDELKIAHRLFLEQLAIEQTKSPQP